VIKYIVKDLESTGEQVSPELYAQVYVSLDGKRSHQGSRGLLKLGDFQARCACGVTGMFTARVDRPLGGRLPNYNQATKDPVESARASPERRWPKNSRPLVQMGWRVSRRLIEE
jgi:hypothetical protein